MPTSQSLVAEAAWVAVGDSFLVARGTDVDCGPLGPVLPLIFGVYDRFGPNSLRILRNRIYSNAILKKFDRAAVRVAAKSCSFVEALPPHVATENYIDASFALLSNAEAELAAKDMGRVLRGSEGMQLARALAAKIPRVDEKYLSSRSVAAVLTDAEGRLLGTGVNTNRTNKAKHAEVNLILNWWAQERRPIPSGSRLFVTLSPCQMCAELIGLMTDDSYQMPVVAGELDPGRHGRHKILSNLSVEADSISRALPEAVQ